MTYYHESKEAALEAGKRFEGHWIVRANLEPYNGWVITLQPRSPLVFSWPLSDILMVAEIDLTGYERLRQRPAEHKAAPPLPERPARTTAAKPPPKPRPVVTELQGEQRIKPAWMNT